MQGEEVYWSIHTAMGCNSKSSEEDSSWAAERASKREGVSQPDVWRRVGGSEVGKFKHKSDEAQQEWLVWR